MVAGQGPMVSDGSGNDSESERVQTVLQKSIGQIVAGGCAGKPAV